MGVHVYVFAVMTYVCTLCLCSRYSQIVNVSLEFSKDKSHKKSMHSKKSRERERRSDNFMWTATIDDRIDYFIRTVRNNNNASFVRTLCMAPVTYICSKRLIKYCVL